MIFTATMSPDGESGPSVWWCFRMRVNSYRLSTVPDAFLRIKPLDSLLVHLMRRSGILTTEAPPHRSRPRLGCSRAVASRQEGYVGCPEEELCGADLYLTICSDLANYRQFPRGPSAFTPEVPSLISPATNSPKFSCPILMKATKAWAMSVLKWTL